MNNANPKVDFYFNKAESWQKEIKTMREIALNSWLKEELKRGCPCYTLGKNNIILIHTFKNYCAFLFFKGVLLKDNNHILAQATKNVQAARQIRFTSLEEIIKLESVIKEYIHEAIELEKSGAKVSFKETSDFAVSEEFQNTLDEMPELKTAFGALTPWRQKAYLLYFSWAKLAKTRQERVEKYIKHIIDWKWLDD